MTPLCPRWSGPLTGSWPTLIRRWSRRRSRMRWRSKNAQTCRPLCTNGRTGASHFPSRSNRLMASPLARDVAAALSARGKRKDRSPVAAGTNGKSRLRPRRPTTPPPIKARQSKSKPGAGWIARMFTLPERARNPGKSRACRDFRIYGHEGPGRRYLRLGGHVLNGGGDGNVVKTFPAKFLHSLQPQFRLKAT